jgi:hypothetical protein
MLPMLLVAQVPQGISYQAVAYDANGFELANQEISVRLGILIETADAESSYSETHQVTTNDFGLFSLLISHGETTDDFSDLNWENGAFLKVELDEDLDGEYTLMGINSFSSVPYSLFAENIPTYYSDEIEGLVSEIGGLNNEIDSLENIVNVVSQYFGCKDHDACNYIATATMSDNSCTYATPGYYCDGECIDTDGDMVCDLDEVEGCTDDTACNYVLGATDDDASCIYQEQYYNCQGTCENDDDGDGTCDELEEGCTDEQADNYNPQALSSTNCIYMGCMDNTSGNYNPQANQDDGSCIPAEACTYPEYLEYDSTAASFSEVLCITLAVYGCTDYTAINYNTQVNVDDDSCEYIYGCTEYYADNYNAEATTDDDSCIYYGCTNPEAGSYDATANTEDGSCLIGGCMNPTADNYNPEAGIDDGTCIIYGCMLSSFPNYNSVANIGDGTCDMNSDDAFGCTDEFTWAYVPSATIDNGSCLYGPIPEVGVLALGGIVFYVDETGQHGLIAALEDIIEGASDPNGYGYNGFEWGCYNQNISGADGYYIGTGYQNTLDIVAQNCQTENGGITAAQASLNYISEGFSDWYLPSRDALSEIHNTIGFCGSQGNVGGMGIIGHQHYWTSNTGYNNEAWYEHFYSNCTSEIYTPRCPRNRSYSVRAVRAF